MKLHETGYGKNLLENQIPSMVHSLHRIGNELERANQLKERELRLKERELDQQEALINLQMKQR
ncbi:hypothetical protein [Gracilibacillus thailandensis]|uniref:Uncharacterized protein n=1 Tax=Gracilibacillus thailandensis TaxID=563735 RepID=A0A6N7QVT8_9BACI|nr:hypothetical protein [Gracilibacillus thailandensis]MRI66223.1 hypothetical protein [Gracilibacillus thailandensis]